MLANISFYSFINNLSNICSYYYEYHSYYGKKNHKILQGFSLEYYYSYIIYYYTVIGIIEML